MSVPEKAIEDVVRKSRNSITPNAGSKLNAIPFGTLADLDHCRLKGCEVAGAEPPPLKKPPMAWPIEEPTATPLEAI